MHRCHETLCIRFSHGRNLGLGLGTAQVRRQHAVGDDKMSLYEAGLLEPLRLEVT